MAVYRLLSEDPFSDRCVEPSCKRGALEGDIRCDLHAPREEHRKGRWDKRKSVRYGYVYAIKAENELIKIGFSWTPEKRFNSIRTASPVPIELLGYTDGSDELETALHVRSASSRSHGEWFSPSHDVMETVEAIVSGDSKFLDRVLALYKGVED